MQNNNYKLSVEKRMTAVEVKLEEILTNHLPHLTQEIQLIKEEVSKIKWYFIVTIGGFAINLLIEFIKANSK